MAANPDKPTAHVAAWGARFLTIGSRIAAFFATRTSRALILLIFTAAALYVAYRQVWQPISGTAALPPGVADRSPQLNSDLLQTINTQRLQRVEAARQLFNVEQLFKPSTGP